MEVREVRQVRQERAPAIAWACVVAAGLVCAAGCNFSVPGFDLASSFDFDGGVIGEGGIVPYDLAGSGFTPSNVVAADVMLGAASLTGPSDIDTDALLIDGVAPPLGVIFQPATQHAEWAVLSVHDLTISVPVTVHGSRSLIVIAAGKAIIDATVHAEANTRTPGPGGQYTGEGDGGDGKESSTSDSGGGGGGHGTPGAAGGPSDATTDNQGGLAGTAYTDALQGGSGGGDGAGADTGDIGGCPANSTYSKGGAGGGAVQISAASAIDLGSSGAINAGGGGGSGGCQQAASAGGGGGSGGSIWIEAPTMSLLGTLAANGGGGGSGGRNEVIILDDGKNGADGALSVTPSAGGASVGSGSGAGGAGGASTTAPVAGGSAGNAGGGGGAVGVIRIRTRMAPPVTGTTTVESPTPDATTDF